MVPSVLTSQAKRGHNWARDELRKCSELAIELEEGLGPPTAPLLLCDHRPVTSCLWASP